MDRIDEVRRVFFDKVIEEGKAAKEQQEYHERTCFHVYNQEVLPAFGEYRRFACCKCGRVLLKAPSPRIATTCAVM